MFVKDIEKISTFIKGKVMLVKGNIVDVGLFVFSVKNVHCKSVDNWNVSEVVFSFKLKWSKD